MNLSKSKAIHKIFETVAYGRADSPALIKPCGAIINYSQLNYSSNFLAKELSLINVKHGDIIAIALKNRFEFLMTQIACLKLGAAFLPLNVDWPPKVVQNYCNQVNAKLLVTDVEGLITSCLSIAIFEANKHAFLMHEECNFISADSAPDDLAYVMFTSGSSGKAKGVKVPHRAVVRLTQEPNFVEINPTDVFLQWSPLTFDASVFEIWCPLLNGAALVCHKNSSLSLVDLLRELRQFQVSTLWLTAALFHLLSEKFSSYFSGLRFLLAGGDVLSAKYVNKVLSENPQLTVINGYGPTENTTFTACHSMTINNPPDDIVPIGKSVTGTDIFVVDQENRLVADGEQGHLLAGGEGVALGYNGAPEKNHLFFKIPSLYDGILYATGDLVCMNDKRELEFIGRQDKQIKIRGFRVSPEEIKTAIVEDKRVLDALVVKKSTGEFDEILVAYIQVESPAQFDIASVRQSLQMKIPKHMVPDKFIPVNSIPINANGKLYEPSLNQTNDESQQL